MRLNEFQKKLVAPMRNAKTLTLSPEEQACFEAELHMKLAALTRQAHIAGIDLETLGLQALEAMAASGEQSMYAKTP